MKYLCFLLLFIPSLAFSQVVGFAYLNGQTDHSGIKVKFIPNSPSAILDSTTTASNGSYSASIAGGVYEVVFSKSGYFNTVYNNGNNIVIAAIDTLTSITLNALNSNIVHVSGYTSGQWSNQNTYIVDGDIIVQNAANLTIESGTKVKFNGNYSIIAEGSLVVNGTASNPVLFTSNYSNPSIDDWNGIQIKSSCSTIDYGIFEYCYRCIQCDRISTSITNSEFRHFDRQGIYGGRIASKIENNYFHSGGMNAEAIVLRSFVSPTFVDSSDYATIKCNRIINSRIGIFGGASDSVISNYLRSPILGEGTGVGYQGESLYMANNLIIGYEDGLNAFSWNGYVTSEYFIINNLFDNNFFSVFAGSNGQINLHGNVMSNSYEAILYGSSWLNGIVNISYNIFFNNIEGFYGYILNQNVGLGQLVSTNLNGDPCDPYFNLFKDPLFIDTINYNLSTNSPCINAGHPSYYSDIGIDHNSNCRIINSLEGDSEVDPKLNTVSVYPNPTNTHIHFKFSEENEGQYSISIFDIQGNLITSKDLLGSDNIIDVSPFNSGIYFYQLTSELESSRGKFIKH